MDFELQTAVHALIRKHGITTLLTQAAFELRRIHTEAGGPPVLMAHADDVDVARDSISFRNRGRQEARDNPKPATPEPGAPMEETSVPCRVRRGHDRDPEPDGPKSTLTFTLSPSECDNGDIRIRFHHDHFVLSNASALALGTALTTLATSLAAKVVAPYITATHAVTGDIRDFDKRATHFTIGPNTTYVLADSSGSQIDTLSMLEWNLSLGGV